MELHDLEGGLWDPLDGDIDPAQVTQALAKGARTMGAKIVAVHPGNRGQAGEWRVDRAPPKKAISAANMWSMRLAITRPEWAEWFLPFGGRPVPVTVMAHQYLPH